MKIRRLSNGGIKMTSQSKEDSLKLLEFLERLAGQGDDPNRLSLKKRAELEKEKEVKP